MSLLPEHASFEELVQDCFFAHRGSGLMLSALDADLLSEWAAAHVPYEVVARGIQRAAEAALWDRRPGEPALRSLRACRRHVSAEIRKFVARSGCAPQTPTVGPSTVVPSGDDAATEPLHVARHKKLVASIRRLGRERPELRERIDTVCARVLGATPGDLDGADLQEQRLWAALLRALPFPSRLELLRESRRLSQNTGGVSPRARRVAWRFHRAAVIRRHLGLKHPW